MGRKAGGAPDDRGASFRQSITRRRGEIPMSRMPWLLVATLALWFMLARAALAHFGAM